MADLKPAIDHWVRDLSAGPWFVFDHFPGGGEAVYRGAPSRADVSIAMGYAGHLQIELIQPNDDEPSVYRETIERWGHGFHHHGVASDDVDRDAADYVARGFEIAYRADVPAGGQAVYLDSGPTHPGFVELIPASEVMDEVFTGFWQASVGRDGSDPIRAVG